VDTVRVGGRQPIEREIIEHPGAVVLLPVTGDGRLLLVRQHRLAAESFMLEAPAGHIESGESPEYAAARELREETGMMAADLEKLGSFWVAPGWCTEHMHAYLATGLSASPLAQDEDEDVHVEATPLTELPRLIASGTICDGKTIAAAYMLLARLLPEGLCDLSTLACERALSRRSGARNV
jgi:8-oxo-dGTP pyrophosphatase MutT (NUDIX family)